LLGSDRATFVAGRLLGALFVMLSVSTLVFFVVRWVPGDPVESILGEHATAVDRAMLAECLRLDQGLAAQYWHFLGDLADGTLGRLCDDPAVTVRDRLLAVLPFTVELAVVSVVLGLVIALPLGVLAALRRGTWLDVLALFLALVGVSIPSFWLGPMLLLLFAVALRAFPDPGSGVVGLMALVLPAITLGTALSAKLARMTRASMLEVLGSDYVRTARAKGLSERVVVFKHALRNALIPIITLFGLTLPYLFGGAVLIETIFAWPGMGRLIVEAIFQRDYPLVMATSFVTAVLVIIGNLLADVLYAVADPRIRND
jgi:ABC-type dipeptide/oligopeptide/nickel transport system permease component